MEDGPDGGSLRANLRGLPERLNEERDSLTASLSSLVLSNYQTHIYNAHCDNDVAGLLKTAGDALPSFGASVASVIASLESSESKASEAQRMHAQLTSALSQQNTRLTELMEAPALMDSCFRAGMYDEALDVADFGTNLYFSHKLWLEDLPLPDPAKAAITLPAGASIIRLVVHDIRKLADDLRESILSQLSGKIALQQCLRLLAPLRRFYTQQALARKSVNEIRAAAALGHLSVAHRAAGTFTLTPEEDQAVIARLRREFLQCRDAWHRGELDSISKHNPYQYVNRIIELQRAQWGEVAGQYVAVVSTLRPAGDLGEPQTLAAQASDVLASRALLAEWLQHRTAWFVRMLASSIPLIDDFANLASLLQVCTYAARRAGRLGCDYSHLIVPLFEVHIQGLVTQRLHEAAATFMSELKAWQWSYKLGYEPDETTKLTLASSRAKGVAHAAATAVAGTGTGIEGGGGTTSVSSSAVAVASLEETASALSPPTALLRSIPLADLTNSLLLLLNSLRSCCPADILTWFVVELQAVLEVCVAAVEGALTSESSPLTALAASRAKPRGGSSTSSSSPTLADDDVAAVRRFDSLCDAFGSEFCPYLRRLLQHLHDVALGKYAATSTGPHLLQPALDAAKVKLTAVRSVVQRTLAA